MPTATRRTCARPTVRCASGRDQRPKATSTSTPSSPRAAPRASTRSIRDTAFLSENAAFAEALEANGIAFIGPRPAHIRLFGQKHTAREAAAAAGVPLLPGSGLVGSVAEALRAAGGIGYPLMLKSTAGGGGIGLQLCRTEAELPALFETVSRLGAANFGDGGLFLEAFVPEARHIEVQIFGDRRGGVIALGERDCSLQRRHQKVIEETPAPRLADTTRRAMTDAAVALGRSVGYASAGTVEFIVDEANDRFFFLEVNTRLQVEHPVTEAVTGIDLVAWMVREAAGTLDLAVPESEGHAIEARIYAEDPARDFRPSAGRITAVRWPQAARVDGWVETGTEIPTLYDPLLAKIIVHGTDRDAAVAALQRALGQTEIHGIETNLDYLRQIAGSPLLTQAAATTRALARFPFAPRSIEVLVPGTQSTLQDVPGRLGLWHVGVPPSGPMDALSHRLANRIVGNAADAAALEITHAGPTLRFHTDAVIALVGAAMAATLDGEPVPSATPVTVPAGATLALGTAAGPGLRATLAVRGGFDAPLTFASRATFTLGEFGGHAVGALRTGDVLRLAHAPAPHATAPLAAPLPLASEWTIGVTYGPHGAPDFFCEADIAALLASAYTVHVNSARTGVRLEGPKPLWARPDGGEAGLHPSNIHDTPYAVGAVDFTGDMPIILGPDGPSLGGFVCPFVVAKAELWKLGQLRPGDTVRFAAMTLAEAAAASHAQSRFVDTLGVPDLGAPAALPSRAVPPEAAIRLARPDRPIPVTYRRAGEDNLLVEFGDNVLDLDLRVRAHALMERIAAERISALINVTPGIRSLQLNYDNTALSEARLLDIVDALERELAPAHDQVVPSRIVHLPLAFDDSQTRLATERYRANTWPEAPWCPSNLEFIRRINGLGSIEDIRRIVYGASYVVYGLGDVYLGAPVATPLDPRHRLVTTKYNPARTWTPQNAVGIGGAYLCIYGMEGPGGYQFVGRTVQVWNTDRRTAPFRDGKPWLLRHFDRIRFTPVDEAELMEMREGFLHGEVEIAIEDGSISLAQHHAELAANAAGIEAFRTTRERAFAAEREAWRAAGLDAAAIEALPAASVDAVAAGARTIDATLSGIVWSLRVGPGDRVAAGDTVAVLEAMKMEVPVAAGVSGRVATILVRPGQMIAAGAPLFTLDDA